MGDPMSPVDPNTNPTLVIDRLNRWRMAFFGLVILVAGVAIGVGATLIWSGHRMTPGSPRRLPPFALNRQARPGATLVENLRRPLRLSEEQVQAIAAIVQERMAAMDAIRDQTRPKIAEQLRRMEKEISEVLTENQQRLWDRLFTRLQDQLQWQAPLQRRGRPLDRGRPMPFQRGRQGQPLESRPIEPGPQDREPLP